MRMPEATGAILHLPGAKRGHMLCGRRRYWKRVGIETRRLPEGISYPFLNGDLWRYGDAICVACLRVRGPRQRRLFRPEETAPNATTRACVGVQPDVPRCSTASCGKQLALF
jgi:hypothetical protein